jgi:hypothetical protein
MDPLQSLDVIVHDKKSILFMYMYKIFMGEGREEEINKLNNNIIKY